MGRAQPDQAAHHAIQDRYAALGTHELIFFDPLLAGPKSLGGPVALQLWRRDASGAFDRLSFGNEPVYPEVLDAWIIPDRRTLHVAEDRCGARRWLTEAEQSVGARPSFASFDRLLERELAELKARVAKP